MKNDIDQTQPKDSERGVSLTEYQGGTCLYFRSITVNSDRHYIGVVSVGSGVPRRSGRNRDEVFIVKVGLGGFCTYGDCFTGTLVDIEVLKTSRHRTSSGFSLKRDTRPVPRWEPSSGHRFRPVCRGWFSAVRTSVVVRDHGGQLPLFCPYQSLTGPGSTRVAVETPLGEVPANG